MTTETEARIPDDDLGSPPTVLVTPGPGSSLDIDVRGHHLVADRKHEQRDLECGPEAIEIFVSGLAACVATYATRYLHRHGLGTSGLSVAASFTLGDKPMRVTAISIRLTIPPHVPEDRVAPLLAMARHCTAHNTFLSPPPIDIRLV